MRSPIRPLLALVAAAFISAGAAEAACRTENFEAADYIVCAFPPEADIRTFWRGSQTQPYATFGNLAAALQGDGITLEFAMNGGMYQDDLSPVGLFVEDGDMLRETNTKSVSVRPEPNFYKKPNGVFYVADGRQGVMTTDAYLKAAPKARFATQSGPMLVIDGQIHPAFIPGSTDRKRRDGVGVSPSGETLFAISAGAVNFDGFARFFRDRLGCPNALFLDGGTAPGLYAPELSRNDLPGHGGYGPIIAVITGAGPKP